MQPWSEVLKEAGKYNIPVGRSLGLEVTPFLSGVVGALLQIASLPGPSVPHLQHTNSCSGCGDTLFIKEFIGINWRNLMTVLLYSAITLSPLVIYLGFCSFRQEKE